MKIAIRYYTRSGNTERLAKAIAEELGVTAEDVSVPLDEKTDVLFLGSSVYAGGVDKSVKEFIETNKENIGEIVNISTAALVRSTYKKVKKLAEKYGVKMAEEEFHCRGAFAIFHKGRPNEKDLDDVKAFAKKYIEEKTEKTE